MLNNPAESIQLHIAKQNTLKAVRLSKQGRSLPHKAIGDLRLRLRFNYFLVKFALQMWVR